MKSHTLVSPSKKLVAELGKYYTVCPRCHKQGSFHQKTVSSKGGHQYRYWYTAHSKNKGNKKGIKWCYIGKKLPKTRYNPLNNRKSLYLNDISKRKKYSEKSLSTKSIQGEED